MGYKTIRISSYNLSNVRKTATTWLCTTYVIEAMGTRYGVVKTVLGSGSWTGWCKNPYINYVDETVEE